MATTKLHVIGRGKLSGCWADSFWVFDGEGRYVSGGANGRPLLTKEKEELVRDYHKYRAYLENELKEVVDAEQIILNAQVYSPKSEALILGNANADA